MNTIEAYEYENNNNEDKSLNKHADFSLTRPSSSLQDWSTKTHCWQCLCTVFDALSKETVTMGNFIHLLERAENSRAYVCVYNAK